MRMERQIQDCHAVVQLYICILCLHVFAMDMLLALPKHDIHLPEFV